MKTNACGWVVGVFGIGKVVARGELAGDDDCRKKISHWSFLLGILTISGGYVVVGNVDNVADFQVVIHSFKHVNTYY